MATETLSTSRRELEEKIIALAWKDDGFRRKFLADPKGQFEERLGTRLPKTMKITAYQEDENSLHFVIPPRPKINLDELSDEDLEKVAGGITPVAVIVAVTLGVASVAVGSIVTPNEGGWAKK